MMRRCIALIDQPSSTNAAESQSSKRGCVGRLPVEPKLLGFPAIASPKCQSQMRLTITRLVSGFLESATQFANAMRRPSIVFGIAAATWSLTTLSVPGDTGWPGEKGSPPVRMAVCSNSPRCKRSFGIRVGAITRATLLVRPL